MYKIKFGTDGWRDIIAHTFTVENVQRVTKATSEWLKASDLPNSVVIGYDCRFGGEMFAKASAHVFADNGIEVFLSDGFVSTPMISLVANKKQVGLGIILTASHNPPSYNGFKLKANYGGPASPATVNEIENLILDEPCIPAGDFEEYKNQGLINYEDFETVYLEHCKSSFSMEDLQNMSHHLFYDAMFGAGRQLVKKLLPDTTILHGEENPGFLGRAPEPILKNLPEASKAIKETEQFQIGLATDGDADRIGFFDENGNFVDSHHLILLLIEYLVDHKKMTGKVVKSFSVSDKIGKLCELKGIETTTTKIGFKYICEHMVNEDVLIGAEESGGIAIKGHIPERDGVWMGLVLMEYAAKTGKTISQLIEDVYAKVGKFAVERYDLHINNELKHSIVDNCRNGVYQSFGKYQVLRTEDIDGYKFHLENESWVMIRPSGTEPVLRVYAEASDSESAIAILEATKAHILN